MAENQQEKIHDRILLVRKALNLKQLELSKIVGFSRAYISEIESGKKNVSKSTQVEYEEKLNVNRKWLETGEGEMFLKQKIETPPKIETTEENTNTGVERFITPEHQPIPVYDDTDGIDNIEELLNNTTIKPVVLIMKGHLGCNLIVRHNDSAMDKDFLQLPNQKCQLGIQRVFNFKNTIVPGMAAIIILDEFTITRYIHLSQNKEQFLLRSADPALFPDMFIAIDDIKQMWKIKSITPVNVSKILMY